MPIHIPTRPKPSADALRDLEDWIGGQLPLSYVQFVCEHDGAQPNENSLVTRDNETGVSRFIRVSEAAALAEEIDGFPARAIPLAEDECGNYFYVEPEFGRVCFWDHEVEGADEVIAVDIFAFVAKLNPFNPTSVKLEPGQVKSVWMDPSFKPEF